MTTAALTISQLSKSYTSHEVLDEVSLEVKPGEILGFIGLNGVGKTTLIKSMVGLLTVEQGDIYIYGHAHHTRKAKAQFGYLPEHFRPSPLLTGGEFIALAMQAHGQAYDREEAKDILQELDFTLQALDKRIASYSKGMVQKIGLASMFLMACPLLILDEPMSGLDPLTRYKFKNLLKKIGKSGKTIFFSTHILSDIGEICDNVAILHNQRIIYTGSPQACKQHYKSKTLESAFLKAIQS